MYESSSACDLHSIQEPIIDVETALLQNAVSKHHTTSLLERLSQMHRDSWFIRTPN